MVEGVALELLCTDHPLSCLDSHAHHTQQSLDRCYSTNFWTKGNTGASIVGTLTNPRTWTGTRANVSIFDKSISTE